jgi:hypothetical protein
MRKGRLYFGAAWMAGMAIFEMARGNDAGAWAAASASAVLLFMALAIPE